MLYSYSSTLLRYSLSSLPGRRTTGPGGDLSGQGLGLGTERDCPELSSRPRQAPIRLRVDACGRAALRDAPCAGGLRRTGHRGDCTARRVVLLDDHAIYCSPPLLTVFVLASVCGTGGPYDVRGRWGRPFQSAAFPPRIRCSSRFVGLCTRATPGRAEASRVPR